MKSLLLAIALLIAAPIAASANPTSATSIVASAPALVYFDSASSAQRHCPNDTVVWLNIPSGIYHYAGERWYGNTKNGTYVCEKAAIAAGDRASRNGQ
jgi:hypothetical protein